MYIFHVMKLSPLVSSSKI